MAGQSLIVGETFSTASSMLSSFCMMLRKLDCNLITYVLMISFFGFLHVFLVHLTPSSVHVVVISQKMVAEFFYLTFSQYTNVVCRMEWQSHCPPRLCPARRLLSSHRCSMRRSTCKTATNQWKPHVPTRIHRPSPARHSETLALSQLNMMNHCQHRSQRVLSPASINWYHRINKPHLPHPAHWQLQLLHSPLQFLLPNWW